MPHTGIIGLEPGLKMIPTGVKKADCLAILVSSLLSESACGDKNHSDGLQTHSS